MFLFTNQAFRNNKQKLFTTSDEFFNSQQNINAQIKVFCGNLLSSGLRFASIWVFSFVKNKPTLVHTLKSRISDPVIFSKTDEKFWAK